MNKKISEKDIKDWKEFTESNSKIENKDIDFVQLEKISNRTLDLHGLTLEIANKKIEQFIKSSFDKNVEKITVITGKGLRSKVDQNPYQSKDLSILKYSVPEFIRNNLELMSLIKKIDDRTENVELEFSEDGIETIANLANDVNSSVENIGARRLHTIIERVLDEISFTATDRSGEKIVVDSDYVKKNLGQLVKDNDLSKFIL